MNIQEQLNALTQNGGSLLFAAAIAFAILFIIIAEWNSRRD